MGMEKQKTEIKKCMHERQARTFDDDDNMVGCKQKTIFWKTEKAHKKLPSYQNIKLYPLYTYLQLQLLQYSLFSLFGCGYFFCVRMSE